MNRFSEIFGRIKFGIDSVSRSYIQSSDKYYPPLTLVVDRIENGNAYISVRPARVAGFIPTINGTAINADPHPTIAVNAANSVYVLLELVPNSSNNGFSNVNVVASNTEFDGKNGSNYYISLGYYSSSNYECISYHSTSIDTNLCGEEGGFLRWAV